MKFASVSSKAKIGNNVTIKDFAVIEDDVEIGDNVEIGSNTFIGNGARIANGVKIFHGAVVSTVPQDLKYKGEPTTLEIGEGSVVREYATLNKGTTYNDKTVIGKNCLIMNYVHLAHDCIVGDNVIIANSVQFGGHVEIEDWAIIGGMVGVHQFVKIGQHSIVGFGFRVPKDVPPFITAGHDPLRFEGLNLVGLKRRGFSDEAIKSISGAYDVIYKSGLNVSDGIKKLREGNITKEVETIIKFIEGSTRGIIRGEK
ncbi:MAG: acyl-ACP--UDP-N-acetylglucosamine O-acyltransferase [Bacteroidetes bacterium]|nr:acyl-ACP--UDP-N-acetylglucosamine O-acyltransferase [Bacteroidota bacterium]